MASTRNKNFPGNYCLEQRKNKDSEIYSLYEHASGGCAFDTKLPGNGLNPGQIPGNQLSSNSVQIESFLFGINSTNLVQPAPKKIQLQSKRLQTANCFETSSILLPDPLAISPFQRPFPI